MKNVFITGASGFIGKKLVSYLALNGVNMRLLSRQSNLDYESIICDIEKEKIPASALKSIDTVFHLAGFAHDMHDSTKAKMRYQKINVEATIHLAELAVKSRVKRFIFVSSVKAGGFSVGGKCSSEEDQDEPSGIYGKTKREAELELLKIGHNSGMHVSIIRPSLVYGPNLKGNLKSMLSGIERGWFPPLPETGNKKSLIHVDDLVCALLLVAKVKSANGEIYIVTDGELYSSREIYTAMCFVLGKPVPRWSLPKLLFDLVAINPSMRNKIKKLFNDECYSSKKIQSLGFKPRYSIMDMNETYF